jgi:lipoyl-dependent peroxiredoxin
MAFSNTLAKAGFTPISVATTAQVVLGKIADAPAITRITLTCHANVPNISQTQFAELAQSAKTGCPISKALAAVPTIELVATLQQLAA